MLKRSEIKALAGQPPAFDDITISLMAGPRLPRAMIRETREVIALARKFNQEVVRPYALELDRRMHEDPEFLPYDFVEKANEWGFYTMWIPRPFGGRGYNMASLAFFIEEVSTACLAMANLIGVHYLGIATLCATWNARLINRLCRDVATGERSGQPCLISLAITEPGAGTDVEETDLIDKGNITCQAMRVDGGYRVNGTKVFISNGHISKWHMLIAYADLEKPSENTVVMAVETGTPGFSFGRMEHKMGQKGCPASELIFKDCFIPMENVCMGEYQADKTRTRAQTAMQIIDYVVSVTRAGVAAFGTGVARGAYEAALAFATETRVAGRLLVNHEWAQCRLAEMYKNVSLSRLSFVETNYANGLYGFFRLLQKKPLFYLWQYLPQFIIDKWVSRFLERKMATWFFRKAQFEGQSDAEIHRTSGWASLAKFAATDAGIRNCHLAIEMMGQAGIRHDGRVEKMLRDAKLLQIYEGTNQLNRLNLFKSLIARDIPQAVVFEQEKAVAALPGAPGRLN